MYAFNPTVTNKINETEIKTVSAWYLDSQTYQTADAKYFVNFSDFLECFVPCNYKYKYIQLEITLTEQNKRSLALIGQHLVSWGLLNDSLDN